MSYPAQTAELTLTLPLGANYGDVLLGAHNRLRVSDGVVVSSSDPAHDSPLLTSAGTEQTQIGAGASVPSIMSVGSVFLAEWVRLQGSVTTEGQITMQNNVQISGDQMPNAALTPADVVGRPIEIPASGEDVHLEPEHQATIAPGSYGDVHVKSRSTLTLTGSDSAIYFVNSLTLEPDAVLRAEPASMPVVLYIRQNVKLESRIQIPPENLLLVHFGTGTALVASPSQGTVVSPNGTIRLGPEDGTAGHRRQQLAAVHPGGLRSVA